MGIDLNEIREHVKLYFKENLPKYTVLEIRRSTNQLQRTAISGLYRQRKRMVHLRCGLHGMNQARALTLGIIT